MSITHAVTCPRCAGKGYIENAVAECGDRTCLCETCSGKGHVPTRWAAMHYMSHDKACDYCGGLKGAAWDGELFACVECWEQQRFPVIEDLLASEEINLLREEQDLSEKGA